ncbi:sugar transferase [Alistipes sp. ZOR0009]|uniref:sugar transferase n=1 Tax=Alistipes sp. ZOR0009 TaxID=1339253 RepID=UPI000648B352|nr:sugar transferase [Alistipes sp. ZOR0009]
MYNHTSKRLIDLLVSLTGILLSLPITISTVLALLITNRGELLFIQQRSGKNGKLFRIIKFKTMNDKQNADGQLLSDEKRLTKVGLFVRKLSIDELPQLINVLKGDMSLIGPRPLLPEYLAHYTPEQARRHDVRPGITGWAQVNGRNTISWEKKFEYDVWYVDNLSFALDVKIFWLTIIKIFKREGISSATSATMERFDLQITKK